MFRDEVGRYIPPGISEGIDKATPALQRDIAKRMQGVTAAAQSAFQPMTLRSAIGVEGSAPLPETGNGFADLASMLVELRGLRSDLQALHGDLGPTIAKYTPSMTIREGEAQAWSRLKQEDSHAVDDLPARRRIKPRRFGWGR